MQSMEHNQVNYFKQPVDLQKKTPQTKNPNKKVLTKLSGLFMPLYGTWETDTKLLSELAFGPTEKSPKDIAFIFKPEKIMK